jgi:SAM-dependent methyltransferase
MATTTHQELNLSARLVKYFFDRFPAQTTKTAASANRSPEEIYALRLAWANAAHDYENEICSFAWVPRLWLQDRDILDLGSDLGGRSTAWAIHFGARHLLGVETSTEATQFATDFAAAKEIYADFRVGTGEAIPFADQSVDAILSNDVFEHLRDPEQTLAECWRILRPGGLAILRFPQAYHPFESHLGHVTHPALPLHLIFPAPSIRAAYSATIRERKLTLPERCEPWEWLPTLNGLTVKRFRHIVSEQGWHVLLWYPQAYFDRRLPPLGHVLRACGNLPLLREILPNRIRVVLQRPNATS